VKLSHLRAVFLLAQPAARVSAIIAEMTNQRAFTLQARPLAQ